MVSATPDLRCLLSMVGGAVRYALLLYMDPVRAAATTATEAERELSAYADVTEDLARAGVFRGGEAFLPATMARFVPSPGDDHANVAAGKGLELGGFFIVECDEEQALEIAAQIPVVTHGVVEVRPLMEFPGPGAAPDDRPG